MAALQALQALAIDSMLPALGQIGRDLHLSDPNGSQLVIGVFLISSGLAALIPGAIADRFGRRPVVLVALVAYFILSLACALVTDFTALLVIRGMLGCFTSCLMVMPMAILRDRFSGDKMAKTQSLISMVFMVVPMVAPMMGQAVMLVAGWRWIFGVMAALSLLVTGWVFLRLPETLHSEFRQKIDPHAILVNMKIALGTRSAQGYIFGAALVQGALFGYINSSQQLVAEHFGAGLYFPQVFGAMALVMAMTNFVNSRIVEAFGARRVSHAALLAYIAIAGVHLYLARNGETLWLFVPMMTLTMCMQSFMGSNFSSIAMQPFSEIAGAAASAISFTRVALGAVLGSIIGMRYDGTPVPLLEAMVVAGFVGLAIVIYSENGRLFRRLHYPGRT